MRTLLDGSVSMQFQGYAPTPEPVNGRTNEDDVEIGSPEQEILAVITEVIKLFIMI